MYPFSTLFDLFILNTVQIMFNIDKAHMIIDEMIMNGYITETNKNRALAPIIVLDKATAKQ